MVEIFEGKLGGGKTFNAVLRIVAHLGRGGIVFTNIELLWEGLVALVAALFGVQIVREQLRELDLDGIRHFHRELACGTEEMSVLCVIDEIDMWFNSRDHAKADSQCRALFEFIKLSRKAKIDLIFIAQACANMDRQFVRQAQYIWRFKDLARIRMPLFGSLFAKVLGGHILAIAFDYDGRTVLEKQWVKKDRRVFEAYNTNAILKSAEIPLTSASPFKLARVSRVNSVWKSIDFGALRRDCAAVGGGLVCGLVLVWRLAA